MLTRTTTANAPADFILLGQKYNNGIPLDDLCGITEEEGFEQLMSSDLCSYEQRCLPAQYGNHISYSDYIKVKLAELDSDSIRPLRAIQMGVGTEYDTTKLTTIETKANWWRNEMAISTPPEPVVEETTEEPTEEPVAEPTE